jgi:hypothetical protein
VLGFEVELAMVFARCVLGESFDDEDEEAGVVEAFEEVVPLPAILEAEKAAPAEPTAR